MIFNGLDLIKKKFKFYGHNLETPMTKNFGTCYFRESLYTLIYITILEEHKVKFKAKKIKLLCLMITQYSNLHFK